MQVQSETYTLKTNQRPQVQIEAERIADCMIAGRKSEAKELWEQFSKQLNNWQGSALIFAIRASVVDRGLDWDDVRKRGE